jgi:hypothetical protein
MITNLDIDSEYPIHLTDCQTDKFCHSNIVTLKLGFCIHEPKYCNTLGVSDTTRDYYASVFERIQKHPYPHLQNITFINQLNQTIVGSHLIEYIQKFDQSYETVSVFHKFLHSKHKNIKPRILKKLDWHLYKLMTISRIFSVTVNNTEIYVLAPWLDMADHDTDSHAVWGYEDHHDRMCIYATTNIPEDSEIRYNYGINEARSGCLNYGIYDNSLKLQIQFKKEHDTDIFIVSKNDTMLKIKKNIETETKSDLCDATKHSIQIYRSVIDQIHHRQIKDSCITKILEDEMIILKMINEWSCKSTKLFVM